MRTDTCIAKELKEYEAMIGEMTENERKDLRAWVKGNNSAWSNPFAVYDDDGRLMDYIPASRHCMKEKPAMLRRELKEYEATIGELTQEERRELRKWVADGNSVHVNPGWMCSESGHPMDFITAIRIEEDMRNNPEDYWPSAEQEWAMEQLEEEIPF